MMIFQLFLAVTICLQFPLFLFSLHQNLHPRYEWYNHTTYKPTVIKNESLLVFISITSGPHHPHLRRSARNTWLIPCILSAKCQYKFFVDIPYHLANDRLLEEQNEFNDMVFRDNCTLMDRHPYYINYGNSPPITSNLIREICNGTAIDSKGKVTNVNCTKVDNPNYRYRNMYKIDWKVCFMKYIQRNYQSVAYHAFVEDDSFICTENLLHQLALVYNRTNNSNNTNKPIYAKKGFRTGTPMYDGFDDSSTLMEDSIAKIFANHYRQDEFDCAINFKLPPEGFGGNEYLSWGNSWIKSNCNWLQAMKDHFNFTVYKPMISCQNAVVNHRHEITFNCTDRPLIFHHHGAHSALLKNPHKHRAQHLCEYMLLIDKVKEPYMFYDLWNSATSDHYHDFSELFFAEDSYLAWKSILQRLDEEERACQKRSNATASQFVYPCLFGNEQARRKLEWIRSFLALSTKRATRYREINSINSVSYKDFFNV